MATIRALIVEDQKSWRVILKRVLKSSSCDPTLAAGYKEAMKKLEEASFDLVTVDMALSEFDQDLNMTSSGWMLVHHLREYSPNTTVVVITGSGGFRENPGLVDDLFRQYNIAGFMWKGDTAELQVKLHELVESIVKSKESGTAQHVTRRRNLVETQKIEGLIRDSANLIREWEQKLQTENRPDEKLGAQRKIQEQWALIERYLAEYRKIVGDKLPPDIAQIAVHFNTVENG